MFGAGGGSVATRLAAFYSTQSTLQCIVVFQVITRGVSLANHLGSLPVAQRTEGDSRRLQGSAGEQSQLLTCACPTAQSSFVMMPMPSPQKPPMVALVGSWNETMMYSSGSMRLSPLIVMGTVFEVSPGAKVTVPEAGV
jgi:hypothetical protein